MVIASLAVLRGAMTGLRGAMTGGSCLGFIFRWLYIQFIGFYYIGCFFILHSFMSVKRIIECMRNVIRLKSLKFMVVGRQSPSMGEHLIVSNDTMRIV